MNTEKFIPFMNKCINRLFYNFTESLRIIEGEKLYTFLGFVGDAPTMVRIAPVNGFVEVYDIEHSDLDDKNHFWASKVTDSFDCGDLFNCKSQSFDLQFGWLRFTFFEKH